MRDAGSDTAKALQNLPKGEGSSLIVVEIESSSLTDARQAVSLLQSEYNINALNMVIANAGISQAWPAVHQAKIADLRHHFDINVLGVVTLFRAMRPLLLCGSTVTPAKFITLGSSAGCLAKMELIPFPNAAYGPSKAALHWISKKIHLENPELVAFPIDPGFVQTDMGNTGAQALGLGPPPQTLEESIAGLMNMVCLQIQCAPPALWDSLVVPCSPVFSVLVIPCIRILTIHHQFDNATREKSGGKLWLWDGTESTW